jgi:hypothetical protein
MAAVIPTSIVPRGPRSILFTCLLLASGLLVSWKWDSLSPHARGIILAAYGVIGLSLLIPALRTRELLKSGIQAQGTVVGAERHSDGGSRGRRSITYHPVVRFVTADGRLAEFTSAVGYASRPDIGAAVPVRYRADAPAQAEIDRAIMWVFPAVMGLVFGLGLLVTGVVSYTEEPRVVPAADDFGGESGSLEPVTQEPVPEVRPAAPKVATGRIGDRLIVSDPSGRAQLAVTVTRLRFATGDELDRPEHGFYMGAYVKAHALSDEQDALDIYALVGGRHYDGDAFTTSTAFEPPLDLLPFHKGERAAGWLVFDVPARHGQLVLRNLDGHKVAVWTY